MFDKRSGLIELLDDLSNKYLGTVGSSRGSWNDQRQCYTGGIFTGCKTSANHEIWKDILRSSPRIIRILLASVFNLRHGLSLVQNSAKCYFEKDGKYYYDNECTVLRNNLAKMKSSLTGKIEVG